MGDRGNIKVLEQYRDDDEFDGPGVYFYTHWSGTEVPQTLADALDKGRSRWDDGPYLARIIFQTLIGGHTGETGYGVSLGICDNEHPIPVVDPKFGRVGLERADGTWEEWTFEEYIAHVRSAVSA